MNDFLRHKFNSTSNVSLAEAEARINNDPKLKAEY
jgi:hypothetical protein